MEEVRCTELGVQDCDFVARGETPKETVDEMVAHLEEEHNIDLPEPHVIMEDYPTEESFLEKIAEAFAGEPDKETRLIVQRLRETLDIGVQEESQLER